jgi:hypothetical protein
MQSVNWSDKVTFLTISFRCKELNMNSEDLKKVSQKLQILMKAERKKTLMSKKVKNRLLIFH